MNEKQMMLVQLQVMEQQLKAMQAQVQGFLRLLEARSGGEPQRELRHEPRESQREQAGRTEPMDPNEPPDVEPVPCPRCGASTEWRYSRTNSQWFLGCTQFRDKGCRGSVSLWRAEQLQTERFNHLAQAFAQDEEEQQRQQDDDGTKIPF